MIVSKMTGLSESEVIGKPASTDISEGESMHLKVLGTRRPVRDLARPIQLSSQRFNFWHIVNDADTAF
jgi:transcriptional regulator with PAS, ATPase and Fis domain